MLLRKPTQSRSSHCSLQLAATTPNSKKQKTLALVRSFRHFCLIYGVFSGLSSFAQAPATTNNTVIASNATTSPVGGATTIAAAGVASSSTLATAQLDSFGNEVERALVRTLEALKEGGIKPALQEIDALLKRNPNFRLGHLVRADLLMAKSGVAVALTGAPGSKSLPDAAANIANLRHEAQVRLNRYFAAPAPDALPTSLLRLAPEHEHVLLVDTARSRIYAFRNVNGKPQRVADFYATIGKRGMEKEREGDQKTPLGVYHVTSTVAREKLPDFYGPGAFPINFPNDVDKRLGRTGSGIWIHGTPSDTYSRPPLASDGCVVLTNDDFVTLGKFVTPGVTPIVIAPNVEWQPQTDWTGTVNGFQSALTAWQRDWESLNMDNYLAHYSPKFDAEGKDFDGWALHKRRVNAQKSFVNVGISNLSIFEYTATVNQPPMMMVTFDQAYKSSNSTNQMKKRQFWQRENGRWKIIFEGAAT
jgi:murein L,D-transpeptidase YafK